MLGEENRVLVRGAREERRAEERTPPEVERPPRLLTGQAPLFSRPGLLRQTSQVDRSSGRPPTVAKVVRRVSCRQTISDRLAARAPRSSRPLNRKAAGML
jgi:hypothetical protein